MIPSEEAYQVTRESSSTTDQLEISIDGDVVRVPARISVAAAIDLHRLLPLRYSVSGQPRKVFCGMGVCYECRVSIDGIPDRLACLEEVRAGMVVEMTRSETKGPLP